MPFTPYHFGPSGFVGLLFRRWIDVPVFVAANVLIDIEVLADSGIPWYFSSAPPQWWFKGFDPDWPVHQLWHFHTLLIGAVAGAIFGALIYAIKPTRWCCQKSMSALGLPSSPTWVSMIAAGALGACLHVFIDSFYHVDVQIFWPHQINQVSQWLGRTTGRNAFYYQSHIRFICKSFYAMMFALYALLLFCRYKKKQQSTPKD